MVPGETRSGLQGWRGSTPARRGRTGLIRRWPFSAATRDRPFFSPPRVVVVAHAPQQFTAARRRSLRESSADDASAIALGRSADAFGLEAALPQLQPYSRASGPHPPSRTWKGGVALARKLLHPSERRKTWVGPLSGSTGGWCLDVVVVSLGAKPAMAIELRGRAQSAFFGVSGRPAKISSRSSFFVDTRPQALAAAFIAIVSAFAAPPRQGSAPSWGVTVAGPRHRS